MTVESRFCMNIAQATTSGTRIGRGARSAAAARLFQRRDDNDNLRSVIYLRFSGTGIMHRIALLLSAFLALTACTATPTVVENSEWRCLRRSEEHTSELQSRFD